MADEGGSRRNSSRRGRLRGLLSRRSTSDEKPTDELDRRYNALKEQLREVQQEAHALVTETEDASRELAQLQGDLEAAEIEAADESLVSDLRSRTEELGKRTRALPERMEELQRRTTELERESEGVGKLVTERAEVYRSATIEGEKLTFEVYKLTATLAAASIAAVSAISIAVGPKPVLAWALYGSYALLLISLGASVLACMYTVLSVVGLLAPGIMRSDPVQSLGGKLAALAALGGLIGGIVLILNFIATNVGR